MEKKTDFERREPEIVYSRSLKAGKRIYYLDVRKARNEDLYLCITESKKKTVGEDVMPQFEKHKMFLYKEDFANFTECLQDVIGYVEKHFGGKIEKREPYIPENSQAEVEDDKSESAEEQPKEKRSFFKRLTDFSKGE